MQKNRIYLCKKCNLSHSYGKCPDYGTTCKNCGLKNHWEIPCRNKKKQRFPITKNTEGRKVSSLEEENLLSPASPVGLAISNRSESQSKTNDSTWFQELSVNGNLVNFKLNSGAELNVLPFEILQDWENIPRIKTNTRPILDYSKKSQS
ncbi:hypothetical protein AVEN_186218-1 [Araneus ventricosus]|uniref:CCHC-type domain-containing protein n=1 Tax=Araneus ventricosus TaxID=182803 RepID=A0A4Y2M5T6_ARAVE|nr:hypothetical protein AVEN_186218-1 [Araneus ventricosus]